MNAPQVVCIGPSLATAFDEKVKGFSHLFDSLDAFWASLADRSIDCATQWWFEQSDVHDAQHAWLAVAERFDLQSCTTFWGVLVPHMRDRAPCYDMLETCLLAGARDLKLVGCTALVPELELKGWWHMRMQEIAYEHGWVSSPDREQTQGLIHDLNAVLVATRAHLDFAHTQGALGHEAHHTAAQAFRLGHELVNTIRSVFEGGANSFMDVRIDDQVTSVVDALQLCTPKGVQIIAHDLPGLLVWANPTQLKRVIWNLLQNALDVMQDVQGEVSVALDHNPEGFVSLTVTDCGPGVSEAHRELLFDDGFTTKRSLPHGASHGHGLAVVRSIVEAHGGTVVYAEREGGGASFCATFPISSRAPDPILHPSRALSSMVALRGVHVMFVEDDPILTEVYTEVLEASGARVTVTACAEDALERFAQESPDVCVLDRSLPGKNGEWLIQALRDSGIQTPIMLCSGYERSAVQGVLDAYEHVAFLQKPVAPMELMEQLVVHLRRETAS